MYDDDRGDREGGGGGGGGLRWRSRWWAVGGGGRSRWWAVVGGRVAMTTAAETIRIRRSDFHFSNYLGGHFTFHFKVIRGPFDRPLSTVESGLFDLLDMEGGEEGTMIGRKKKKR